MPVVSLNTWNLWVLTAFKMMSEKLEMTPVFLRQFVWLYERLAKRRANSSAGASWSALNQGQGDPLVLPPPSTPSSEQGDPGDCGPEGGLPGGPKKVGSQCPWGVPGDVGIRAV